MTREHFSLVSPSKPSPQKMPAQRNRFEKSKVRERERAKENRKATYQAPSILLPERQIPHEAHEQDLGIPIRGRVRGCIRAQQRAVQEAQDEPVGTRAQHAGEQDQGGFGGEGKVWIQERRDARRYRRRRHVCFLFLADLIAIP